MNCPEAQSQDEKVGLIRRKYSLIFGRGAGEGGMVMGSGVKGSSIKQ